jgi:hypothetical protein
VIFNNLENSNPKKYSKEETMELLLVTAVAEKGTAAAVPGNMDPCSLIVGVTHLDGQSVSGLSKDNFKVQLFLGAIPRLTATVGFKESPAAPNGIRVPGLYLLRVNHDHSWTADIYALVVEVLTTTDRGLATANLEIR